MTARLVPVDVQVTEDPIRTNFTLNRQQMNIEGGAILDSQGAAGTSHVGGLAHGIIAADMQASFLNPTMIQGNQGYGCAVVEQITSHISYQPNIFISREYQQGTCYHRVVMEHEMKHVMTDRQIVHDYTPMMKQAFMAAASKIGVRGPVAASQIPLLNAQIKGEIVAAMNQVMEAMKKDREYRQSQIDTPAEYARVQSLCTNWP